MVFTKCIFFYVIGTIIQDTLRGEMSMKIKILELIEEILQVPAGTVTEDTLMEDLEEWDSLAHVMIIGQLEELGISIDLEDAAEITSVREILEMAGV